MSIIFSFNIIFHVIKFGLNVNRKDVRKVISKNLFLNFEFYVAF